MEDELTRWELVWGGAVLWGAHSLLAALVLWSALSALWAGVLAVLLWIGVILQTPLLLDWLGREHPAWASLSPAYRRLRLMYILVLGYGAGTLGLAVLNASVRTVVFREDVVVRELVFNTALLAYMIIASLPGLLLLLAVPAWIVGRIGAWGLRSVLGFIGFVLAAGGAVAVVFGPVYLVTDVLGDGGPRGPEAAGLPAAVLFWGLYGLVTLLGLFAAMAFSGWDGLRRPRQRR